MDRHTLVFQLTKAPQIIEAKNVVHVSVRVEHGVNFRNILPQALSAEIWRRINDEREAIRLNANRCAEPLIPRVGGFANLASAPYDWNPMRGSGSQKCDLHVLHRLEFARQAGILWPCPQR